MAREKGIQGARNRSTKLCSGGPNNEPISSGKTSTTTRSAVVAADGQMRSKCIDRVIGKARASKREGRRD